MTLQSDVLNEAHIVRQLSTGHGEALLVADFQEYSTAPRLSQMLSDLAGDRPVYQIDPVGFLSSQDRLYMSLPELAEVCATAIRSSGAAGHPAIMIGYCSASPLALHINRLLADTCDITSTIVVRPTWATDEHVWTRFDEFLSDLRAAPRPCPSLDGDAHEVVARIEDIFRGELNVLARRSALKEATGAFTELLAWHRAWVAFLLAGRNDQQMTWAGGVTIIADGPAAGTLPGVDPGAIQVVRIPPQPQYPVTQEIADAVYAQFAGV
jgi:hypothetical protein